MTMRKMLALLLAAALVLGLAACQGDAPTEPSETTQATLPAEMTYKVQVVNALGKPYSNGVIVKFNGSESAMQPVDETGTASKTLPTGTYTVELVFTDAEASYYYDTANVTLTPEQPQLQLQLALQQGDRHMTLVTTGTSPAQVLLEGSSRVQLAPGLNYFLYEPTQEGKYEFTASAGKMSFCGQVSMIDSEVTAPAENNTFQVEFGQDAVKYPLSNGVVICLQADSATEAVVTILPEGAAADQVVDADTANVKTLSRFDLHEATFVVAGCTYVTLKAGMNYFLYDPTEEGSFCISAPGSDAKVGYYGIPAYVQNKCPLEIVNNTVTLSIKDSMIGEPGSNTIVLGLEATGDCNAVLSIERTGDSAWDVTDEPWITYTAQSVLSQYTLPEGAELKNFDLNAASDAYKLVKNEEDGFYHLGSADGPLALAYVNAATEYMGSILDMATSGSVCRYFYDDSGKFIRRETYNACIQEYGQYCDESGVYPLTEDLLYMFQNIGEHNGWWDMDNIGTCLFYDENDIPLPDINPDIAWMFLLCYIEA